MPTVLIKLAVEVNADPGTSVVAQVGNLRKRQLSNMPQRT
jgi:hypothetical protein